MSDDVDTFTRALRRSAAQQEALKEAKFAPLDTPFLRAIRKQNAKGGHDQP